MRNVAVIGMGHVGATVAFTLFTHGIVDNLYLLDKNQNDLDLVISEINKLNNLLILLYYILYINPNIFSNMRIFMLNTLIKIK